MLVKFGSEQWSFPAAVWPARFGMWEAGSLGRVRHEPPRAPVGNPTENKPIARPGRSFPVSPPRRTRAPYAPVDLFQFARVLKAQEMASGRRIPSEGAAF
jgi:hypothetical protein